MLETEVKFIIYSDEPAAVARKISDLTEVGEYRLVPKGTVAIRDTYLDTDKFELRSKQLALRIREFDSEQLITFKGPERLTAWGAMERVEIEKRWSRDALKSVIAELALSSIDIPQPSLEFEAVEPITEMEKLGFHAFQVRQNCRTIRNVVGASAGGSTAYAELVIDSVTFRFGHQEIVHHEVEIEAKEQSGIEAIQSVMKCLTATNGPLLRRWVHSKVAIGIAMEKLLEEGELEGSIGAENNLKPAGYDKVDEYLKRYN